MMRSDRHNAKFLNIKIFFEFNNILKQNKP